jgi:hypothetical protein
MMFIADRTLGKLVKYLRMLGYDTICYKQKNNDELIRVAEEQGRLLLTRKVRLKAKTPGKCIFHITQDNPKKQLDEVLNYYHLSPNTDSFFARCLICNEELTAIPKEDAEGKVPEYILKSYITFFLCPVCKRIFWPGSHYERMMKGFIHSNCQRH